MEGKSSTDLLYSSAAYYNWRVDDVVVVACAGISKAGSH